MKPDRRAHAYELTTLGQRKKIKTCSKWMHQPTSPTPKLKHRGGTRRLAQALRRGLTFCSLPQQSGQSADASLGRRIHSGLLCGEKSWHCVARRVPSSSQPVARRTGATRAEQIMCYRERVRRVKRRDECVLGGPDAVKDMVLHAEGHPEKHGKRALGHSST
jgi:hypothetical protein